MKRSVSFLFILATMSSFAQTSQKQETANPFGVSVFAGMLEGGNSTSFQFQATGGIRLSKWYIGAGSGMDYYFYRSTPVFISVNRYLSKGPHSFFIQGEGGMNFAWAASKIEDGWGNIISDKWKPGLYWNGGLGFSTGLGKKNSLMLSLGYSYKHLKELQEKAIFCINPPCPPQKEEFNYHLRRLSFKIGWQFFGD
jgi:hypothetical protein